MGCFPPKPSDKMLLHVVLSGPPRISASYYQVEIRDLPRNCYWEDYGKLNAENFIPRG
jgi:hypothetical protein